MIDVLAQMKSIPWVYSVQDNDAVLALEERIAATGKKLGLITYSQLVHGVEFHLTSVNKGKTYRIRTFDWTGLDRRIIGDFLGYISMRSFESAGFMASALVVSGMEFKPSWHFFDWMETLGVLPDMKDETVMAFWAQQVNLAHTWYKKH